MRLLRFARNDKVWMFFCISPDKCSSYYPPFVLFFLGVFVVNFPLPVISGSGDPSYLILSLQYSRISARVFSNGISGSHPVAFLNREASP
jgi:hypothetical protein